MSLLVDMDTGKSRACFILLAIGLATVACNLAQQIAASPSNGQQAEYTAAAQTIVAELTQSASKNAAEAPTEVNPSPTESNTPEPTETPCNHATFVSDVTIIDGTAIVNGETFTKTWRLLNSGICSWTTDYQLVFDHGDAMKGASTTQFADQPVPPGEAVDISIKLTAPDEPGTYQGYWKLRSGDGEIFGLGKESDTAFWVEIRATEAGADGSSQGAVLVSGQMEFGTVVATADFDEGIFAPEYEDGDVILHPNKRIEPRNGALIAIWGAGAPSFSDCTSLGLSSNPIIIDESMVGKYLCYRTNLGKPGYIYITLFNQLTFNFDFITWKEP